MSDRMVSKYLDSNKFSLYEPFSDLITKIDDIWINSKYPSEFNVHKTFALLRLYLKTMFPEAKKMINEESIFVYSVNKMFA